MYPLIDVSVERGWTQRGERKNERTRERNVREQNKYGERTQQVEKKKKWCLHLLITNANAN
jgi:hypothetical protein